VRRIQVFTISRQLQVYFGHLVIDSARQWSVSECSAVRGQARPLVEVLHLFSAMTREENYYYYYYYYQIIITKRGLLNQNRYITLELY